MLIAVAFSGIFFSLNPIETVKADQPEMNPDNFILWAVSDTHSETIWDDDVSFDNGVWSGNMIDDVVTRIDFAVNAGDILSDGGSAETTSAYINSTHNCLINNSSDMQTDFWDLSADERIWGFCMGNHEDNNGGCTEAAEGLGLESGIGWYNSSVTMCHGYNYTVQRGNLLFVFIGGNRDNPTEYAYDINTSDDFAWFREQVEWADANECNVIVVTHLGLWNGSIMNGYVPDKINSNVFYNVTSGEWEAETEYTKNTGFRDPWFNGVSTDGWNASDSFYDLINASQNINLWLSGHTHSRHDELEDSQVLYEHGGWDTTLGVARDVQKGEYLTHINLGGGGPWDSDWEQTRVIIFTNDSSDILVKSFDHDANEYGDDVGWVSSHQNITLTGVLKYPYNPLWGEESDISFNSINNQQNNAVVVDDFRNFNWTSISGATRYQLQIANDSGFTDVFYDRNNINSSNYASVFYHEAGDYVYFNITNIYDEGACRGDTHHYRVRAYIG